MRVIDILCRPWAILPGKLEELRQIYLSHARGEAINLEELAVRLGRPLGNRLAGEIFEMGGDSTGKSYSVRNGVAIIPLEGVIGKKMNLFAEMSGGTSSQQIQAMIHEAVQDKAVKTIALLVDSPGGTVDGTQELASAVRAADAIKPVYAFAEDLMASAAYWVGSAARKVYLTNETTQVGSIGVVATHVDTSRAEEMEGVKYTELTAGKYKRAASQHAPLSETGRDTIQAEIDQVYGIFVDDVARNRKTTKAHVSNDMAEGRIFVGREAIRVGLADDVLTLGEFLHASDSSSGSFFAPPAIAAGAKENQMELKKLNQILGLPPDTPEAEAQKALEERLAASGSKPDSEAGKHLRAILQLPAEATDDQVIGAVAVMVPRAEIEALRGQLSVNQAENLVTQGVREQKITPAMKDWARGWAARDEAGFKAWLAVAPVVGPPLGLRPPVTPENAAAVSGRLTREEAAVAQAAGLSIEEFAERKKALEDYDRANPVN